ncbi:hypothetical protein LJ656_24445 [Paraburkholderia sp. MMS20-SJTR3]|uniref:Uncharacterized protein n=1 Tax=Paraburkholderia sejongensis TaxID=2886946 RepID=A0ABS8K0P1_9BURK|nr:hypothetical protein [Paraburkholderia sp. MMS20-SJTR3]MCC8395738.1 hypothetical protein [Paraburkholderia sp. MMS20-SJTR3]
MPFNTTALSKDDRQAIEKAVRKAQEWQRLPYVELQIIVVSGAYIGERDLDILQDRRGEVVKRLLVKLGVRSSEFGDIC